MALFASSSSYRPNLCSTFTQALIAPSHSFLLKTSSAGRSGIDILCPILRMNGKAEVRRAVMRGIR